MYRPNRKLAPSGRPEVSDATAWLMSLLLTVLLPGAAQATNGLNQIGFGAESMGMAGADLAVAQDSSALNTNPAGLSQISGSLLDLNGAIGYLGTTRHKDGLGNDRANSNDIAVLNTMGYAHRLEDMPLTLGIALFAQGGAGNEFRDINTAFGTQDDMSVLFRVARITPGVSWQLNDKVSLGASLIVTYSDMEQEVFPDTSYLGPTPETSFFGTKLSDMNDLSTGVKLGLMYKPDERLTIGAAYTSQVDLELGGGTLVADMTALGLGKVKYRDVEASGLNQPQELGLGLAYQYSDRLLLAAELNWIDWSRAINRSRLTAADPDNAAAPASLELVATHDWNDQYVLALGMRYDLADDKVLRFGYNYGKNPIPSSHLSPLMNMCMEHHLTMGMGMKVNQLWRFDGTLEWDIKKSVTYTNEELPFGPDAETEGSVLALHLRMSRSW